MISEIKFLCPLNIEGDNAQLTIDDSVGGGELSYKTAKICLLGDVNMDGNISVLMLPKCRMVLQERLS